VNPLPNLCRLAAATTAELEEGWTPSRGDETPAVGAAAATAAESEDAAVFFFPVWSSARRFNTQHLVGYKRMIKQAAAE